jgi:tetratricopeptide (TPR) repeat protein
MPIDELQSMDIKLLITRIDRDGFVNEQNLESILDRLQDYECWLPYFRLIESEIDNPKKRQLKYYVRIAKTYITYLEDSQKAAKVCVRLLRDLRLGYFDFREKVLTLIVSEQDFESEGQILQAISPRLRSKEDSVACLERLCHIFEKKRYDENQLNSCYLRLFELDPANLKALRYFKVVYTQNNQWDKVVQVLQSLFQNAKHANDRFRSAQELAAVYLYQLDQPQSAIDIIEKHCLDSPLNTFTIHYEAYFRQQNWEGCLRVLQGHLRKSDGSLNKAIIHFKIGELQEQLRKSGEAERSYLHSLELAPKMLEPLEKMIELHIEQQQWSGVISDLNKLCELVDDTHLKDKIRDGRNRLQDAIDSSRKVLVSE